MRTQFTVAIALGSLLLYSPRAETRSLQVVTMSVSAGPGFSRGVVTGTLEEAAEIWRQAEIDLQWRGVDPECAAVRVTFEDAGRTTRDGVAILGWILFESDVPIPEIHLSSESAVALIRAEAGAIVSSRMTISERQTLLSRALGRALAHELGHYLLGSKQHTRTGLMQAHLRTPQLLGNRQDGFDLDPAQRALVAARLTNIATWRATGR